MTRSPLRCATNFVFQVRSLLALASASLIVLATLPFQAQNLSPNASAAVADNSRRNAGIPVTADAQPNDQADRRTLAQVRKAIVADKALSIYAHNIKIKIIVVSGKVTLEGPVHSDDERQQVLADAAAVVNSTLIVDKITVP